MRILRLFLIALLFTLSTAYDYKTYNHTVKNLQSGCSCAGGSIPTWNYETIPLTSAGIGCIGGCGGTRFEIHDYSTTVSVLRVWKGSGSPDDGLKSIEVELFNGKKQTVGITPSRGPDASYEFAPGETIVGDIELCGNGIGSRTGRISFTTSRQKNIYGWG